MEEIATQTTLFVRKKDEHANRKCVYDREKEGGWRDRGCIRNRGRDGL